MDGLQNLNALPEPSAREVLLRCCGSSRWVSEMVRKRPFRDEAELFEVSRKIWNGLEREDWLEAFRHHPRIGDKNSLLKFATTRLWASSEQSGVSSAREETLEALAEGNRLYEEKFGHIFIVCATGKGAEEILELLRTRLSNAPAQELTIAAEEQDKITRLRLEKLLKGR